MQGEDSMNPILGASLFLWVPALVGFEGRPTKENQSYFGGAPRNKLMPYLLKGNQERGDWSWEGGRVGVTH